MKEVLAFDLVAKVPHEELADRIRETTPNLVWRQGDSDSQGRYLSGSDNVRSRVKIWLDDIPIAMSISFSGWPETLTDRETKKQQFLASFMAQLTEIVTTVDVTPP
jgi:hypothetical protein